MRQDDGVIEVRPGGRRRIDRVLDAGFLQGIGGLALREIRARRDDAAQEETDLSYLRRLLHARIDIVKAEQHRRTCGDSSSVVESLASILSDNALGPATGSGRHQPLEPSRAGEHRREAEALIGNSDLSDVTALEPAALSDALTTYREQEESVSLRRREVQQVVDTLNAEIAGRYASGSASVDELIGRERAGDEPL